MCLYVCVCEWEKLQYNIVFFYLTQENCLLGLMEFEIVFLLVGNSFCLFLSEKAHATWRKIIR